MDEFIAKNHQTLKCCDIFNIYHRFVFEDLKEYRGTSSGFTGLSEFLIFRFLYHQLGGSFEPRPSTKDLKEFISKCGDFRIGPIPIEGIGKRRKYPDISIYHSNELIAIISVKASLTGGIKELNREMKIWEEIRIRYPKVLVLLIIFYLSKKGKIFRELRQQKNAKGWFNFLILQGNEEPLMQKLQQFLGLDRITVVT
jgi:hypothetical protein